jgi:hypothetical protein
VVEDDVDAHVLDAADLGHQVLAGKSIRGNAEVHHAARDGSGLVDLGPVPQAREVVRGRQPARSRPHDEDAPAARRSVDGGMRST